MPFSPAIFLLGLAVGYVSGLFGKGGSAIATPLLQLLGVPAFSAIVSPLPATIPGTLVASLAYLKSGHWHRQVVLGGIAVGVPATLVGAWLSKFVNGEPLLVASNVILVGLGLAFLIRRKSPPEIDDQSEDTIPPINTAHAMFVALVVGLVSGLLANSGGFLLAPLYHKVLKLPLKSAFACSLLVSAALALPGTIVHMALGHIDWAVVLAFGLGSVPFSYLGARTAIRMPVKALEFFFGIVLVGIGLWGAVDAIALLQRGQS